MYISREIFLHEFFYACLIFFVAGMTMACKPTEKEQ